MFDYEQCFYLHCEALVFTVGKEVCDESAFL